VGAPLELNRSDLEAIADPAALLDIAWVMEPLTRLAERQAALQRLQELLEVGEEPPAPPGRNWRLELLAERAIHAAAFTAPSTGGEMADQVLAEADPSEQIAIARALMAKAQSLAWTGTDTTAREADRTFGQAAELCAELGHAEWQGSAILRRGYVVCYQCLGDLPRAMTLIREALDTWDPDSPRRAAALIGYVDVLIDMGQFDLADEALDEAATLADLPGAQVHARAFVDWGRARVATGRDDAFRTERYLLEVDRQSAGRDWFETHIGSAFLLEAAELLDRVGLREQARQYLERARQLDNDADGAVRATTAVLLARTGDPVQALASLQEIVRSDWIEKRLVWRYLLLSGWATFRAGRDGAGELVARALAEALACGSVEIARAGEPVLVAALAPLGERAGSQAARELMLDGRDLIVRVFGVASVTYADGRSSELPPGMPGELVRMLAINEHGLPVDVVLEALFPDAPADAARQRLRQVLTRLRAVLGEVVVREEDRLRLVPAWVDLREFLAASHRVRGAQGQRAVLLAYAALALHGGEPLKDDTYAEWAQETREDVSYRHLAMLDVVAADAAARGSHQEALTALEAAVAEDPGEISRHTAIAEQLRALGRSQAAEHVARRVRPEPGSGA
jgi:DNA-binding SARP family transcriptional activator/tetratricopeptide (TPR) repeat protein